MLMVDNERIGKNNEFSRAIASAITQIERTSFTLNVLSETDVAKLKSALDLGATHLDRRTAEQVGLANALIVEALKIIRSETGSTALLRRLKAAFALSYPGVPGGAFRALDE